MFETQKSGNKTSSGDIDLNIRTLASPKVVSGVFARRVRCHDVALFYFLFGGFLFWFSFSFIICISF